MNATQGQVGEMGDRRRQPLASWALRALKMVTSRLGSLLSPRKSPNFMLRPPHTYCLIQIMGSIWGKGQPKSQCCCCVELAAVGVVFLASRILFLLATRPGILPHPELSNHESPWQLLPW